MKKENVIIVAIDFSKCSIKALEYAVSIANNIKSNILIVYVEKLQTTDSIYSKNGHECRLKIVDNLDKLVAKYQPLLKKGKVEYKIRKGKVHKEIANQAKYSDAYMIVAGTHGISGFEEYFIGSNAFRIVTSSSIPVITIREDFIFKQKHIKKIVLPIDSSAETRQKVPFAVEMAKHFNSEIHIIGIYSTNIKAVKNYIESYTKQAVEYIEKRGIVCKSEYKFCKNITEGIIEYSQEIKSDLVIIMSEQESSTKDIWLGRSAQQMVNHSPIPVLTLNSKD